MHICFQFNDLLIIEKKLITCAIYISYTEESVAFKIIVFVDRTFINNFSYEDRTFFKKNGIHLFRTRSVPNFSTFPATISKQIPLWYISFISAVAVDNKYRVTEKECRECKFLLRI